LLAGKCQQPIRKSEPKDVPLRLRHCESVNVTLPLSTVAVAPLKVPNSPASRWIEGVFWGGFWMPMPLQRLSSIPLYLFTAPRIALLGLVIICIRNLSQ